MKELGALANLEALTVGGLEFTGTGLRDLKGLKNLKHLRVEAKLTDIGWKYLSEFTNLRRLELNMTGKSETGLKDLKEALRDTWVTGR
jgi:hypothetical protein